MVPAAWGQGGTARWGTSSDPVTFPALVRGIEIMCQSLEFTETKVKDDENHSFLMCLCLLSFYYQYLHLSRTM